MKYIYLNYREELIKFARDLRTAEPSGSLFFIIFIFGFNELRILKMLNYCFSK